jgi:hypothetical protein
MSNTNKNIDQLFLHKSFHELSKEEKLEVSEFATTESEFNDTKMMLLSVQKELNSIKDIEPKESTKKHLLNEFNKIRPAKTSRPMGLDILFPSDKPFHRKLGVQILAIAAAFVLIFTFFDPSKDTLTQENETAVIDEDSNVSEEQLTKEISTKEEITHELEDDVNNEKDYNPNTQLENDNTGENKTIIPEKVVPPPPTPSIIADIYDKESTSDLKAKKENNSVSNDSEELAEDGNVFFEDNESDDEDLAVVMDESISSNVNTGTSSKDFADVSVSPAVDAMETFAAATTSAEAEKSRNMSAPQTEILLKVKTSKTLAENKELIKHFYTAM